jgi:hypothetical protein
MRLPNTSKCISSLLPVRVVVEGKQTIGRKKTAAGGDEVTDHELEKKKKEKIYSV